MWPFSPPAVAFEQAVYGNFPFWDRGFDVHGRSPGCRPEWIAAFKESCQRLGDRPRGAAPPGGIVARSLADGTWLVIGPSPLGTDDRGRPDAVAFHGLFLDRGEARRIGYRPFGLRDAFRRHWEASDVALERGRHRVDRPAVGGDGRSDEEVAAIVEALRHGRRVLVEADGPIDRLGDHVWSRLPVRLRARRSMATWAYVDAGAFDLLGLPRLTGVDPSDRSLLVLPKEAAERPPDRVGPGVS